MKPPIFDYVAPVSVLEVLNLLADDSRDVKVVAGGQSLVPMLNMRLARPELLVDITRISELGELYVDDDGRLHVGAAVRQAEVIASPIARASWPLLVGAIKQIGHPQIRNRGTVCGSLVHHDPAAELPAVAVALEAEFVIAGPRGTRRVPAEAFFVGTFQTALEDDELLVETVFPPALSPGWSFLELARRHGDFATIGVAVSMRATIDAVDAVRVVFCGAGDTPVRVADVEGSLTGHALDAAARSRACEAASAHLRPPADVHASREYRREAAAVLLDRALQQAWERCHDH